jgi:hypothetical protein
MDKVQKRNKFNTEGSLLCSQEPATGHYPEPDESSSQPLKLFIQNPF